MNDLEFAKLLNGLPDEMLSEAYIPARKKPRMIIMFSAAAACFAGVIAAALYAKVSVQPPERIVEPAATSRAAQTTGFETALSLPETVTETHSTAYTAQTTASAAFTETSAVTASESTQTTYSETGSTAQTASYTRRTTTVPPRTTAAASSVTPETAAATTASVTVSATTASVTASAATEPVTETFAATTAFTAETSVYETTWLTQTAAGTTYAATSGGGEYHPAEAEIMFAFLDEDGQTHVSGVQVQIYDLEGEQIAAFETDGNPVTLTLNTNINYRLHIAAVPDGYVFPRRNRLFNTDSEEIRIYLKHQ